MSTRLYIESQEIELDEGVIMPINFSVDNIRDISKAESAFSKTITVPGTASNNKLFNFLFNPKAVQTGIDTGRNIGSNYDFKKKAAAYVMQDGTVTFRGYARLVDTTITNGNATYSIQIVSELTSFSSALADKRLEDLPAEITNVYEHILTRDFVFNSWDEADTDPAGEGVILYPLADYGITDTVNAGNFYLACFRPALFIKQYIDHIFEAAGFTYASDFLNSESFKRKVFPHNGQPFEGKGYAAKVETCEDAFRDMGSQTGYSTAVGGQNYPFECVVEDESSNYDDHFYTAPVSTNYDVSAVFPDVVFRFTMEFFVSAVKNTKQRFWFVYEKHAPDFSSSVVVASYPREFTVGEILNHGVFSFDGGEYAHITDELITITAPTRQIFLQAGEHLAVSVYLASEQADDDQIYRAPNYLPGTIELIASAVNKPRLEISIAKSFENSLVQFENFVPKDVKQKDFLSSVFRLFGLLPVPDKERPKHFNIYQREEFYQTGTVKDWSKKVDYSQEFKVTPVPSLDSSLLNFSYKEDKDFWNEVYTARYGKIYGEFTIDTKYEFNQNTKDVLESNIFSPTPVVQYANENFPCETTCEILTADKDMFYASGYSELEGTELPGGSGFVKAKEGVKIIYDGNIYQIIKVFNPFKFQVDADVTGSDDGGFWAKFGIFTYITENDKIIPCIYESKDGNVTRQPFRSNPRILHYSGKKSCAEYVVQETPLLIDRDYTYPNSPYATEKTEYPVLSHLDDNSNPTSDLLFDRPARVYFQGLNYYPHYFAADTNTYTPDFVNLYKGWRNAVNEITDNEAKLISCKMFLNAVDIANLSLADTIVVDGTYYRINKVIDYMPGANRSTAVELVRKPKQDYDPVPAPPPDAECVSYSAMNHAGLVPQPIRYYDCDGVLVEHVIPPGDTHVFCALEGSLQHPAYILVSPGDGECGEPLPECKQYSLHNSSDTFGISVEYRNCDNEEIDIIINPGQTILRCALEGSIVAPIDIVISETGFPCGF